MSDLNQLTAEELMVKEHISVKNDISFEEAVKIIETTLESSGQSRDTICCGHGSALEWPLKTILPERDVSARFLGTIDVL